MSKTHCFLCELKTTDLYENYDKRMKMNVNVCQTCLISMDDEKFYFEHAIAKLKPKVVIP